MGDDSLHLHIAKHSPDADMALMSVVTEFQCAQKHEAHTICTVKQQFAIVGHSGLLARLLHAVSIGRFNHSTRCMLDILKVLIGSLNHDVNCMLRTPKMLIGTDVSCKLYIPKVDIDSQQACGQEQALAEGNSKGKGKGRGKGRARQAHLVSACTSMLSSVSCCPLPGTSLLKPAWLTGVGPDMPLPGDGGVI